MNNEVHVVELFKGAERYVFKFTLKTTDQVLRTFGRFASDPRLSFNWYDAAVLSHRVRCRDWSVSMRPPSGGFRIMDCGE